MKQRTLGRSGLHIGRLALGTLTWGRATDEDDAREQLLAFAAAGGTLVDTADVYCDGDSERMLGRLLAETDLADSLVVATKSVSRPGTHRRFDASRKHLLESLDGSLRRLALDCIDLWQLHAWDPSTPLDETLGAIATAIAAGKVRYVGISNYSGWQTALAATVMTQTSISTPIVSTQVEYSLLQRGVEREVVPASQHLGVSLLPWSPLGRGVLTGKYRGGSPADSRAANPEFASFVAPYLNDRAQLIVEAVMTAADGLGATPAQVALAWVRDRPGVAAPVVGARSVGQLNAALASEEVELPAVLTEALADISAPPSGYPDTGWNQRKL